MTPLRDTPIKGKLTAITMLTSGVALLLACVAFVTYELTAFRTNTVDELSTTAAIVGDNSGAALAFDDPDSARQTLRSLNVHPHIVGAALYDRNGKLFASYDRADAGMQFQAPRLEGQGHRFEQDRLKLFYGFDLAGEHAGTVYIESDLSELRALMIRYALIGGCVLLVSWAVAFLLAARLQRAISAPISHLALVMNQVQARNDYSLRATKRGNDELGALIDGFNSMLDQIRAQDSALQEARDNLEQRVAERTGELERTHRKLVDASRQAGMAEVATNVLHNVGNVLNSVNVSASMVTEQRASARRRASLGKARRVAARARAGPRRATSRTIRRDVTCRHTCRSCPSTSCRARQQSADELSSLRSQHRSHQGDRGDAAELCEGLGRPANRCSPATCSRTRCA